MLPNQRQPEMTGWFMDGIPGVTPRSSKGSVAAAVQLGRVYRHKDPGYLWLPDGRGRMSYETAVTEGVCDQAAIEYINKQSGCFDLNPQVGRVIPANARPGTMAVYEGTWAGDIVNALVLWGRNRESVDSQFALAKAIDEALAQRS